MPDPTPAPLSPFDQWRLLCRAVDFINCKSGEWERTQLRLRRTWLVKAIGFLTEALAAVEAEYERQLTGNYHRRKADQGDAP